MSDRPKRKRRQETPRTRVRYTIMVLINREYLINRFRLLVMLIMLDMLRMASL